MTRRDFLFFNSILLASLGLGGCATESSWSPKIGYLPISDHLLIIAKELQKSAFIPLKLQSWADLSEVFRAKHIDGAFILTPLALVLKQKGLDIKALFAAHRNGSALVVKKGLINTKKDINTLKSLSIAIPSRFSTHYLLLATFLKQKGLNLNDVQLVDMSPPEMIFAVASQSIDGFIVAEPFSLLAEQKKLVDVFVLSKDIIPYHSCCIFCVHNDIIKNRRIEIELLTQNFIKSAYFIHKNPEEASKISSQFLGYKSHLISNLLSQNQRVIYQDLALSPNDIQYTIQSMKENNIADISISYDEFVDNSFIRDVR
ncbi:hypothetical protein CCZ01_05970 [Helicobacter monodelphidis]|uniref:ABC transporter substrate-binding protein n=1 Tax=Helicobacter sp. 15-1451 TaxID=2004995 RepID=UPI000DCC5C49|nr:ABC transporter substrate-binding protein [Helicobacter sp. 15-1451]RAX57527.1 hypothetical protein CCZ01_05970 [Helicobacter sp. 15-1451]